MVINKTHFVWAGEPFREYDIDIASRNVHITVDSLRGTYYGLIVREMHNGKLVSLSRYTVDTLYYDAIVEILCADYGVIVSPVDFKRIVSHETNRRRN